MESCFERALQGWGRGGGVASLGDPVDHGQVLSGSAHAFAGGVPGGGSLRLLCAGSILLEIHNSGAMSTQIREEC